MVNVDNYQQSYPHVDKLVENILVPVFINL